jgi:hypothetical protein
VKFLGLCVEEEGMSTLSIRSTSSERVAAAIAHAGTVFAWLFAPLVVYVLKKDESRFVAFQSMQSFLWSALGTLVAAATCGLAIPVFLVVHVIAAVKTLEGADYEYPLVADLARKWM